MDIQSRSNQVIISARAIETEMDAQIAVNIVTGGVTATAISGAIEETTIQGEA
jgi:hypothetical protein